MQPVPCRKRPTSRVVLAAQGSIATRSGRSSSRRYRGVRCCVSVWLVLCQFPLPVVHAHPADAVDQLSLASHLDRHHRADPHDTEQWHWHLMMPWELGPEQNGEDSGSSNLAPSRIWAPRDELTAQLGHTFEWYPECAISRFVARLATVIHAVDSDAHLDRPPGFLSTYDGVSLVALVCVSLR